MWLILPRRDLINGRCVLCTLSVFVIESMYAKKTSDSPAGSFSSKRMRLHLQSGYFSHGASFRDLDPAADKYAACLNDAAPANLRLDAFDHCRAELQR